jgi:hypothetical protein
VLLSFLEPQKLTLEKFFFRIINMIESAIAVVRKEDLQKLITMLASQERSSAVVTVTRFPPEAMHQSRDCRHVFSICDEVLSALLT